MTTHRQANIPLLKKAQELLKEYEDCEVKYYCNICPDFSTIDLTTLSEHHCSFHEFVDPGSVGPWKVSEVE